MPPEQSPYPEIPCAPASEPEQSHYPEPSRAPELSGMAMKEPEEGERITRSAQETFGQVLRPSC